MITKSLNSGGSSKVLFGTRQWAKDNVNFINGCASDCKYCYAKAKAIYHGRKTPANWKDEVVRAKDLNKKHPLYSETVMFPSSHDIHPDHLDGAIKVLGNLLVSGNKVLVTSKPHLACIERICQEFVNYRKNILFRFTIGSIDSQTLNFWEPNAPDISERLECLNHAHGRGFNTSVSCEPMLDGNVEGIVDEVDPLVNDSIWIGKMNHLIMRLTTNGVTDSATMDRAKQLLQQQSDSNIRSLYQKLKGNPKIEWKESIQEVVGINVPAKRRLGI